jgi:hypothetical protein
MTSSGIEPATYGLLAYYLNQLRYHKLFNSIWNKKELPQHWLQSIIVPVYETDDITDCNNYPGISLLPTLYKMLSVQSLKVKSICR